MSHAARSPYLQGQSRLADVMAAIQFLGTYKFYKLDVDAWTKRLKVRPKSAATWAQIFEDHSEFFRIDLGDRKASLIWRRARPKRYNVDTRKTMTTGEYNQLGPAEKKRISRAPLEADQIMTLVSTALEMHTRALAQKSEMRWWVPVVAGFLGVVVGSAIQAYWG